MVSVKVARLKGDSRVVSDGSMAAREFRPHLTRTSTLALTLVLLAWTGQRLYHGEDTAHQAASVVGLRTSWRRLATIATWWRTRVCPANVASHCKRVWASFVPVQVVDVVFVGIWSPLLRRVAVRARVKMCMWRKESGEVQWTSQTGHSRIMVELNLQGKR